MTILDSRANGANAIAEIIHTVIITTICGLLDSALEASLHTIATPSEKIMHIPLFNATLDEILTFLLRTIILIASAVVCIAPKETK